MKSPRIFTKKGFTLIEILIAIAVMTIVGAIGLFMSMDQYRAYVLGSDRNTLVAMVQQARNRAMNNVNEAAHGISVQPSNFVIFQGTSYVSRNAAFDQNVPRSPAVSITGLQEIVFSQLRGDLISSSGITTLQSGLRSLQIEVNTEGRINW